MTDSAQEQARGMTQAETFEWLRERSNRLDEVEAKLIAAELELARLRVKPIVDAEKKGEDVGDLMELRLDAALPQQSLQEMCDTEDRCRKLLTAYDKSSPDGVVPLDEVIAVALAQPTGEHREVVRGILSQSLCGHDESECKEVDGYHTDELRQRIIAALAATPQVDAAAAAREVVQCIVTYLNGPRTDASLSVSNIESIIQRHVRRGK